jgi:hypothetical protein
MITVLTYRMDTEERLLFELDWSEVMRETSDTIAASEWSTNGALTIGDADFSNSETSVWVSAVPEDSESLVVNRVTTAAGRVYRRAMSISSA